MNDDEYQSMILITPLLFITIALLCPGLRRYPMGIGHNHKLRNNPGISIE
jgi:hypothetical protein